MTTFLKLNHGWNAEPNAPNPRVKIEGDDIVVSFILNPFQFPQFDEEDVGKLRFISCRRFRLGSTNDEGWYRGQCRFSNLAPAWGEFYEVGGDLRLPVCPDDWIEVSAHPDACRHFLFYFKDQAFECDAADWHFELVKVKDSSALLPTT